MALPEFLPTCTLTTRYWPLAMVRLATGRSTLTWRGSVPQFVYVTVRVVTAVTLLLLLFVEDVPTRKFKVCDEVAALSSADAQRVTLIVPLNFELAGIWKRQSATSVLA